MIRQFLATLLLCAAAGILASELVDDASPAVRAAGGLSWPMQTVTATATITTTATATEPATPTASPTATVTLAPTETPWIVTVPVTVTRVVTVVATVVVTAPPDPTGTPAPLPFWLEAGPGVILDGMRAPLLPGGGTGPAESWHYIGVADDIRGAVAWADAGYAYVVACGIPAPTPTAEPEPVTLWLPVLVKPRRR